MPAAFDKGDWEHALLEFTRICKESGVIWYLTGSACDAVRGIDVWPHDLKTPITTMKGYSQALIEGVVTEEGQRKEYLLAIHRKSVQLDELVSILFDYAKLMTLQEIPKLEQIDLIELIKENIGLFYTDFEEKKIDFTFKLPEESVYIQGDSKQLERVFSNIYD